MGQILYLILIVLAAVAADSDRFANEIPSQFHRTGRIIGGEGTTIREHPYQVSLELRNYHVCGGSIINPTTILTAADCVLRAGSIRAGTTTREKHGQVINISQKISHPKYDSSSDDYDIGIVILESPLTLSEKVRPIELPDEGEELPVGTNCTVTGWGNLHEGGIDFSNILQKVVIPSVSQEICKEVYLAVHSKITPQMLCAGDIDCGGKGTCIGDKGGPLVALGKLHGIVSWARGCGRRAYPDVFTRVTAVRDWIRSVTGV